MSSGSSSRPPARRKPGQRPASTGKSARAKPPTGKTGRSKPGTGKPSGRRGAAKPLTEAERRALEVKARRAPRAPRDPEIERRRIEERTTEEWVDEGSVRRAASGAARRASTTTGAEPPRRRQPKPLDPEVSAELVEALGAQRGARLAERLAQASEALDRERYQESRRIATSISKEAPAVAAAHEIVGLANYRLGNYKHAVKALQTAQDLHPNPAMLPVIADCQRALGRWAAVDEVWAELRAASPNHEIMAEGRMVAAGALADQGDLRGAIDLMGPAAKRPKTVRDHHLRQWYVLGDLYDRVGDPINARRWFAAVAARDGEFADVSSRLRALGR
jgi:tetratricopeptide (TPR) repeat protein